MIDCCGCHIFTWAGGWMTELPPDGMTCQCGERIVKNGKIEINEAMKGIYDYRLEWEMKKYYNTMGIVCTN